METNHFVLRENGSKEYSDNKAIVQSGLFENEIGPGVFQFSVQQTCSLQESQRHKAYVTDNGSIMSPFCPCRTVIIARWSGALQLQRRFQIHNNFIFRMLCCTHHPLKISRALDST